MINKFRGDVSILEPGLKMLEDRTDIPVLGVVPYFYLDLDEEDSLTERFHKKEKPGLVDIAVIKDLKFYGSCTAGGNQRSFSPVYFISGRFRTAGSGYPSGQ